MKTVIKSEIEAELKLMKQRELVDFAVDWIEKNRK